MHKIDAVFKELSRLYEFNRQIRRFEWKPALAGGENESMAQRKVAGRRTETNAANESES